MGRNASTKRIAGVAGRDSACPEKLPGPARGVEAVGFTASLVITALVFSYLVHKLGGGQQVFLPMHGPVLLGGLILNPVYAAVVGLLAPALSSGFTDYPQPGQAFRWMIELAACGLLASLVYQIAAPRVNMSGLTRYLPGVIAIAAGILGAFIAVVIISMLDFGFSGFSYYLTTFFSPSKISYILLIVISPVLGLKFRQSASSSPNKKPPARPVRRQP